MSMMPANGDDVPAATGVVELGYPAVAPVMRDMVRWMRVAESRVADTFAAFFGRLGAPAVAVIAEGLRKDDCCMKHRIFTMVLPHWPPEVVSQLTSVLAMTATHPDASDNDLRAMAILAELRLADPQWLKEWLKFKKDRMSIRDEILRQVEKQLASI